MIRGGRCALLSALAACGAVASPAGAQGVVPSAVPMPQARARAAVAVPDSLRKAPLSPRRAMLLSLLIPGYAQSRLRRPTSSMIFATAEVLSIGMARKSALDLREAKNAAGDSVPSAYEIDPTTGVITPTEFVPSRFTPERVKARRTHYEDWITAILFTHVISAVDAYVAANLWDFNANIDPATRTATVTKRIGF